jgi:FkbM family methyltransferase
MKFARWVERNGGDEGFTFVQVGANDGMTDDDICGYVRRFGWSGVLVEPLDDVFERLRSNYSDVNDLRFVKSAIVPEAPSDGKVVFYRHPRYPQCSGLTIETRMQRRAEMQEIEVQAITMRDLVESYNIVRVDLLQIDVEGHDHEIVDAFPFNLVLPRCIRYESKHLDDLTHRSLVDKLSGLGYDSHLEGNDSVSYLKD